MTNLIRFVCLLVLACAVVGPFGGRASANTIVAQNAQTSGGITGTVKDVSGAPVAGATLKLSGPTSASTQSDQAGNFSFASVVPGLYVLSVTKPGYETAVSQNLPVIAGETQNLAVSMQAATLKSLNVIASVVARRGGFNTSTASTATISSQTFADQAQPQVMQILNQTPGIVASYPGGSANGAIPGAITFPDIRGSLSFETASLIDGHPVSVGQYGDYVTTFLNSFMLAGVEVVKGPGAMAPETNYAIGGTVNFITKDPTYKPSGTLTLGGGTFGSRIANANYSGTSTDGKWGWVLAYALDDTPGPLNNTGIWFDPGGSGIVNGNSISFQDWKVIPHNVFSDSAPYNATSLIACCQHASSEYHSQSELVKLRYAFSHATVATLSYFGSQTIANQTANTSSQVYSIFDPSLAGGFPPNSPPAPYTGPVHPGHIYLNQPFFPTNEEEFNNEPVFEADLRTTIGNDSLLFRGYTAAIDRLANQGGDNPNVPQTMNVQLFGTDYESCGHNCLAPMATYNGQVVPVQFFGYYHQFELDNLRGYSAEYDHNIGNNVISLAYDHTHSSTFAGTWAFDSFNTPKVDANQFIPPGSTQDFGTFLLRGIFYVGSKWQATGSAYLNTYNSRFAVNCKGGCPQFPNPQPFGFIFNTNSASHFDGRVGLVYRPNTNVALRFSAGSAIAPPYLNLLSQLTTAPTFTSGSSFATQTTANAGNLKPETAFGYDIGADVRFNGGVDTVSTDLYLTNLFNQYIQQSKPNGTCVPQTGSETVPCTPGSGAGAVPVFAFGYVNLTNARYEGVELAYHHAPSVGLGWSVSGALQKAYPYNLSPCFYFSAPPCAGGPSAYNTNLAVLPNQNFIGGVGGNANGVSNQNIPYAQGYGELNYHSLGGLYASFGETYIGNNNSYGRKPFFIGNASLRIGLHSGQSLQLSASNLFNQYSNIYPLLGAGVPVGLANGQIGLTQANVLGPRLVTLVFTQNFGGNP